MGIQQRSDFSRRPPLFSRQSPKFSRHFFGGGKIFPPSRTRGGGLGPKRGKQRRGVGVGIGAVAVVVGLVSVVVGLVAVAIN